MRFREIDIAVSNCEIAIGHHTAHLESLEQMAVYAALIQSWANELEKMAQARATDSAGEKP